ncbi:MAG: hypothetical protein PHV49_06890 [Alistipes sp.]|nr:hypothetical protein [Alistipes sp.]
MNLLICAAEVREIAFASALESLTDDMIPSAKIEIAQQKFLCPVFNTLFPKLFETEYASFVTDYIKPALAYYVRYELLNDLSTTIGASGIGQSHTEYTSAPAELRIQRMRTEARHTADLWIDQAVAYVEAHPDDFPTYDPRLNLRHQQLLRGGVIL